MYPAGELTLLATRKALVRVRIAEHRWQCIEAGAVIVAPVEKLDHALAIWRRISPLAKVIGIPLAMLLARRFVKRAAKYGAFLKFAPIVLQAARMVAGMRGKRRSAADAEDSDDSDEASAFSRSSEEWPPSDRE
jgi:hypothetical protein